MIRRSVRERGMTMVEIMVSVLLVGIAAAFTFSIQVRASSAFRDQATVSELQQTLRASSDMLVHDIRQAGYMATSVTTTLSGGTIQGVKIVDNASGDGTDTITVYYADESAMAHVTTNNANMSTAPNSYNATPVDSVTGFAVNDLILATRTTTGTGYPAIGTACVLQITSITSTSPYAIGHQQSTGPWNQTGQTQCAALAPYWGNGGTVFTHVVMRTYRIKPSDQRGILQMSPSATQVANDWVDLADGIVDLQVAVRMYQVGDLVDDDHDGDATRDWYSGTNMATAAGVPLDVSLTLVAKTTKDVNGSLPTATPDVGGSSTYPNNNSIGDRSAIALPVASTSSPYYGNFLYRTYTTLIDLRNLGVGF